MLFEFKIATRFLTYGRMQTLFIILGISIGIAVQIFLSSLIDGLQKDLINKTVGDAPHITAKPPEKDAAARVGETSGTFVNNTTSDTNLQEKRISNWTGMEGQISKRSDVKAVAAFADGSGFVTKGQKNLPVIIRGMDLNESNAIYKIKERIIIGEARVGGNEILIGKSLADSIGAKPQSLIRLTTPEGIDDVFTVSGIFELGNDSINKSWVLMDRSRAQKLLGLGGDVTSLEIQVREVFGADTVAAELSSFFPEVQFQSWQESNKQLLTALKSQSSSSGMIQFFVIMAVALGISSVLAVSVMQKSKQIGILKAMGADNSTCSKIFLLQGGILGLLGSILGCGLGIGLIESFTFFTAKSDGAIFKIIVDSQTVFFSLGLAIFVGIAAAMIPARSSVKLNPIEVIRNG